MTEPSGGSSRPKRPVVVPAVALVAATAFGITALMGGLNQAPEKKPTELTTGQVLDQGQFDTKVLESKVTFIRAPNKYAKDKRYLDLIFNVTNKGKSTAPTGKPPSGKDTYGYGFAGTLRQIEPQIKTQFGPDVYVQAKGDSTSRQLQPGIPSTVVVRYELDLAAEPPDKVAIALGKMEERPSSLTEIVDWYPETDLKVEPDPLSWEGLKAPLVGEGRPRLMQPPTVVATISLPVKQEAS